MAGEKRKSQTHDEHALSMIASGHADTAGANTPTSRQLELREIHVVVLTPIRLFGDGLSVCFGARPNFRVVAAVDNTTALKHVLATRHANLALIDVTQGIDWLEVQAIAAQWPEVALVALGLHEHKQEVIRCGRAGFAGYIGRDASIDTLCNALSEIAEGKLDCPPEISGGLLRALFRGDGNEERSDPELGLTRRESEVLERVSQGLTNKEIGNELCLSVATVKHHVHSILEKLKLTSRAQAMRRVRDAPWLVRTPLARGGAQKSNG